jgi:hypothetical protein
LIDLTALLLSHLQSAFTISFHIIFPSFTIGLAAFSDDAAFGAATAVVPKFVSPRSGLALHGGEWRPCLRGPVFLLMLIYTAIIYTVFRGKIPPRRTNTKDKPSGPHMKPGGDPVGLGW